MAADARTLVSARCELRRWRPGDRAPFASLNADEQVMEHFPSTLTAAESDALADRIEATFDRDGFGLWALEIPGVVEFAGFVGLSPVRDGEPFDFAPAVEIGWRLAPACWGHGYASESARTVLSYAFGELQLDEVVSFTATSNVRSQAVMVRIGLHHDPARDFDHPRIATGHRLRRHVLFAAERAPWLAEQAAGPALRGSVEPR